MNQLMSSVVRRSEVFYPSTQVELFSFVFFVWILHEKLCINTALHII